MPGTQSSGGTLQGHDDYCHDSFDWNDNYVGNDYMGLADISQNPFHYEGSDHYENPFHYAGAVLHEDYDQARLMDMK